MLFLSMLVSCASRPAPPTVVPVEPEMPLDPRAVRAIAVRSCPAPRPTSEAVELAQCPGPGKWMRGDGLGVSEEELPPIRTGHPLPEWDVARLLDFACAYACAAEGAEARLLMWSVIEDSRPLRNHKAFTLVHDPEAEEPWVLVDLYRHATNTWWNLTQGSFHFPGRPIEKLDHPPTAAELDAMLARTGDAWQWEDETYDNGEERVTGFVVKAGNVLDTVWTEALEPPSRTFLPPVEYVGL